MPSSAGWQRLLNGITPDSIVAPSPRCCSPCSNDVRDLTPALILGSLVERIRFSAVLWFTSLWVCSSTHLSRIGCGAAGSSPRRRSDFAGQPLFTSRRVSALVAALFGKRKTLARPPSTAQPRLTS